MTRVDTPKRIFLKTYTCAHSLRSRKPKHEAHDDGCSNVLHALLPGIKAIPEFGGLKERKSDQSWTLVIGPRSFTANHSSFDHVCGVCAGTGLLAF